MKLLGDASPLAAGNGDFMHDRAVNNVCEWLDVHVLLKQI